MRPEELEEPEGMEEQEYPEGFKEVFDTQYKRILDYAKILFGDAPGTVSGRTEDAAQETFLRAWRAYGSFRGGSSERTWLTAIAANVCRNLLRAPWERRRVDLSLLEERPAEEPAAPDDTVLRAVLSLPAKYRQVVVLYYYRECSTGEIAEMLGLPQGTVSVRLKRARERLRPMLKEWYEDGT